MSVQPWRPSLPPVLRLAPVVIPGREPDVADTVVLEVLPPRVSGLHRARMTDGQGRQLYAGWVPTGTRLVMRGQRVFSHYDGDEWRQVAVVTLGEDGYPI